MKIYTSDSNKLLIDKLTQEIADKASANTLENYCIIVPEKFSVTMEKLVLEKSVAHTFLNVQVATLSRLLYKLISSENNYLSKIMGIMATKKVILENYDNLVCYKKTAKTMGFAENIYDTISELKNSKVSPEDYYSKNKTNTSLDIKLHDIFLLYNAYEKFLKKEGLVDACDRFDLLADEIYKSEYIKNSHVYIMGYDSTTRSGLMVFEAIARRAKSITCACNDNSGKGNSYVCPPEMLNNYLEIARNIGVKPVVTKFMSSGVSVPLHIANNLYAYPYNKMQVENEVALYEANSVFEELSVVAQDIRRNIIEKGLRYRDFAVVCSDAESLKDMIASVFSDYQLPYFIDVAEKLAQHPLARFLENALNVLRKNYSSEDVLSLCSNIFSGVSTQEYSKLENYVVKYAINYDDFKKTFIYTTKDPDELKIAESVRQRIIGKLEVIEKLVKKARTAIDFNVAINKLFDAFEIDSLIDALEEELGKHGKLAIRDVTKQVKGKIEELLLGADKVLGETKIDLDEYFAVLQSGLVSETVSLIPVTVDNVFIGEVSTSKFFGVKYLYIIGATDGAIPRVKDDCGMIVDKELQLISTTLGKKIEPTIKTINAREKFKLINILQEFTDRLTISYSLVSKTGEEQRPSSLVREISKIFYRVDRSKPLEIITKERLLKFSGLMRQEDKIDYYAYQFASPEIALKEILTSIRKQKEGQVIEDKQYYDSLFDVLQNIGELRYKTILNNAVTKMQSTELKNAGKLYFKDNKTSVSQIECYFSCPFKFFASFGLRLKPRDEAYLKSVDYGNVLHKIAELYIKNIKKFEVDNGRPIIEKSKEIEKLINFVFNEEKLKTANNKYMLIQLKREAYRLIDALTYQYRESNFKPISEEVVFGSNGSKIEGVKLCKNIQIAGKIDRIDTYKNYYRVIDYKTGHIDLSPKTTYYGAKVQLFTYLKAMENAKMKPAGAFYLPIRNVFVDENEGDNYMTYKMQGYYNNNAEVIKNMDRRISPENNKSDIVNITVSSSKENKETNTIVANGNNAFSEEEINMLSDYTREASSIAVDEILSGYTKPSPLESDGRIPCDYCEFRNACGRDFNSSQDVRKQKSNIKFENFIKKDASDDKSK